MKRTNDEIEEPVRRSPWVLVGGVLILLLLTVLGVFLLVEALKTPDGPQDILDMKRMAASGIGVILFSLAVLFFLIRLFKPSSTLKKSVKHKPAKRKKSSKR